MKTYEVKGSVYDLVDDIYNAIEDFQDTLSENSYKSHLNQVFTEVEDLGNGNFKVFHSNDSDYNRDMDNTYHDFIKLVFDDGTLVFEYIENFSLTCDGICDMIKNYKELKSKNLIENIQARS